MNSFDSLTLAFKYLFDKPLRDLPAALRQRIDKDFCLMPWDHLSEAGRRAMMQEWDYRNDPATKKERLDSWDNAKRELDINAQIGMWEAISTPTALDLAEKENRLANLRQELAVSQVSDFVEVDPINIPLPNKLKMWSKDLQSSGAANASVKRQGSTVRREARKLATQERHKKLQKEYQALRKKHPAKTGVWCSLQIANMKIGQGLSAETIRKYMKK